MRKITHCTPVQSGEIDGRLGKSTFIPLRIILDCNSRSKIVLGKHRKKLRKKKNNQVCSSTQLGDLNNKHTSKVENLLPKIDVTKTVMWKYQINDPQGRHR